MDKSHEQFMREAIKLSEKSIDEDGGPFGAIIVKGGEIISRGSNKVTLCNDPTAHAEINAIREAAEKLGNYDLKGCTIYSSCEPCPMCLGAIYWAHIDKIYYANTRRDAKAIKFDDSLIYEELAKPIQKRRVQTEQILRDEANVAFDKWLNKSDKTEY